jgi:hypothetical protein
MRFFDVLPPGIRFTGEQIIVDLAAVARQYGAADALTHLTHLEVTTAAGQVVVAARGAIRARP